MKKNILLVSSLLISGMLIAQTETTTTSAPSSHDNSMLYLLVGGAAILLVAIFLLGNVLVSLTKLAFDKRKTISVIALVLASGFLFAQEPTNASAQPTPTTGNFFSIFADLNMVAGVFVIAIELMVLLWMLLRVRALLIEISGEKKQVKQIEFHLPHLFDNLNASVAIEKEKDILLDHNYDGIRELDNALPPWWKYSFYISIVWAFFYLGYYYIGGGPSSLDEYNTEVEIAKAEVDAFNKKNALNVDESNVQLADAAGVLEGMETFKTNCVACHGNLGEGNTVGPNLTDAYWLHGGSLNEIFKSVKYGWPAKGMKSWETDLSALQIKNVTGYIHSLLGSNPPNAKAPQGDLSAEGGATITDSTVVTVTDSIKK